jgi:hypothetical protein
MSVLAIVIPIVSIIAIGAMCYAIIYVSDNNRKLADQKRELEEMHCIRDNEEEETESDEEEFQDLRHHRLIHDPPRGAAYQPMPSDINTYAETVKYQQPTPPSIEEYNDIRVFYSTSLPVVLEDLNVENCIECELLDAVIPRGGYVIHSQNQTFQVRQPFEASVQTFTNITIPQGDYSASALATKITSLVNTAGLTGFSLLFQSLTKNFTVYNDSVTDLSFNSELAYDLGWGTTTNLPLGSVQFPIAANGSYDVTVINQSFEVSINSGAYTTYTLALNTYTAATLGAAFNTALSSPLAASYLSDGNPLLVLYHTTGAALDVRLSQGLMELMASTTSAGSSVYNASSGVYYSTSARADLYGSRYVEIQTVELNAPHLHHRGVLQAAFLSNELTNWRANGADALRRRRFPAPISIRQLTVSFKERHPSKSLPRDFYNMELNGLAISMCICFRRLRYKNESQSVQLGAH